MGILRRRSLLPDALSLNVAAAALEQQACWVGASMLLAEAQNRDDRLLGPEAATVSAAVDACERHGCTFRAAGLLREVGCSTPSNLRDIMHAVQKNMSVHLQK
ncbi:hypothetical protein AK812_SmicGene42583 [Symbiodinium microadriaticum]|uniref:Uncharacterized protein n=1 Tax=Symbiodinium microadriaticum TaxID=2951 RepID=A0A1Q9C366_SYMMI|nr:hypothetical protein AK812_SmicGene42583 [Symbiodinium microadriaticum]